MHDCGALHVADTFDKSFSSRVYVYDDRDLGYTDWTDTEPAFRSKCFMGMNPNGAAVVLLPIDGRTVTGANVVQGGVCDGMLLTEKEMTFLEFKTEVVSEDYQTILQRADKAIGQLWHTYDGIVAPRCMRLSRNIGELLSVDFYVVFDKDLEVTGVNSQLMDKQAQFLEDHRHLLYFANEKTFG